MFVVCHMLTSLDGKIDGAFFGSAETAPALQAYAELLGYYNCPATLYGTTTMLGGYADGPAPALTTDGAISAREDYINADGLNMGNFIVSVDLSVQRGKHVADNEHIIPPHKLLLPSAAPPRPWASPHRRQAG